MQKRVRRTDEPVVDSNTSEPKTEAEKIWGEIKDKKIEMFSLPSQVVSQYCKPTPVDPSKLFLVLSATSVLPSLEAAIGPSYVVDRVERFVTVARKL